MFKLNKKGESEIFILIGIVLVLFVILFAMWGLPKYGVYRKTLSGEAKLKEAEWSRQITIKEAEAKQKSAKSLGVAAITQAEYAAKAEIERAKGVAEANEIIGASLDGNEAYLRYLWIQGLNNGKNETIYIPTEANLPILEANRRK